MILSVLLILLFYCEPIKEDDCCICTVKTTWVYEGFTLTAEKEYPFCDIDLEWMDNYEKINTYTDTVNKMYQTCNCRFIK